MTRRRGVFLADCIVALTILGVLMGIVLPAISRQRSATAAQRDTRACVYMAQRVLSALRQGAAPPALDGAVVHVSRDGTVTAPSGYVWVTVTVQDAGRTSSLTGLVGAQERAPSPRPSPGLPGEGEVKK